MLCCGRWRESPHQQARYGPGGAAARLEVGRRPGDTGMHGHGGHLCIRLAGSALMWSAEATSRARLGAAISPRLQQQKVFDAAAVLRSARQTLPRFYMPLARRHLIGVSPFAEWVFVAVVQNGRAGGVGRGAQQPQGTATVFTEHLASADVSF